MREGGGDGCGAGEGGGARAQTYQEQTRGQLLHHTAAAEAIKSRDQRGSHRGASTPPIARTGRLVKVAS